VIELDQHTAMADYPDTWARIIEMARAQFPGDEPAAQAFTRDVYDAEDTAAYAATAQDADDEQHAVLDAARRVAQLCGELYAELWGEATASTAAGQSARAVARPTHAEVLHATNAEVPDEVDNDESDDFADFDDEEDASDPTDEQRADTSQTYL
jgi:hypothetical protein